MFYNKDLFKKYGVKVPTTWAHSRSRVPETFKKNSSCPMTAGGKDGTAVLVAGYGILLSAYPDQAALVRGVSGAGTIKWNDARSVEMWKKMSSWPVT